MTTAREIVRKIIGAGGELWVDGDRVRGRNIPRRLAEMVRADEGAILAVLLSKPDPDEYDIEERAAIMEHDGGLPREEAERLAGIVPIEMHPAPEAYKSHPPAARPVASTGQQTASVTCGGCQHFTRDAIHPAEGLGRCSATSNGLPPPGGRGYGCCLPGAPRSCPEFLGVVAT